MQDLNEAKDTITTDVHLPTSALPASTCPHCLAYLFEIRSFMLRIITLQSFQRV